MKLTGAIFDMDGTLLNSMDYWKTAAETYLRGLGVEPDEGEGRRFLEQGMKKCVPYYNERYGINKSFEEVRRGIYDVMKEKYDTCVEIKDGARELLENLYARGVKMCLATATDREQVEGILKRLGIEKYFSRIFTTSEVGEGKSSPLIYNIALDYLGTKKEETYIFEDAVYAISTAYQNGFKVCGVYDKNVYAAEDEIIPMCDVYLDKDSKYKLELD